MLRVVAKEVRTQRFKVLPNGDSANSRVKQIASAIWCYVDYLNNANEIEIKIAQGAKPGEGDSYQVLK